VLFRSDANRIIVEIAAKKPGYKQQFIKIEQEKQTNSSAISEFFFGKEDRYQYIPITSYRQNGDSLAIEKFGKDGVTEAMKFSLKRN